VRGIRRGLHSSLRRLAEGSRTYFHPTRILPGPLGCVGTQRCSVVFRRTKPRVLWTKRPIPQSLIPQPRYRDFVTLGPNEFAPPSTGAIFHRNRRVGGCRARMLTVVPSCRAPTARPEVLECGCAGDIFGCRIRTHTKQSTRSNSVKPKAEPVSSKVATVRGKTDFVSLRLIVTGVAPGVIDDSSTVGASSSGRFGGLAA